MTTRPAPSILWFRRDLRLADNPALVHAADGGRPVLAVYILDEGPHVRPMGAASRWWLDRSLRALDTSLRVRGSRLILRRGDSEAELRRLIDETGADAVFMNRLFEPDAFQRDADIARALQTEGIACKGFNATLLTRPGEILSGAGAPYKVFTPYLKAMLSLGQSARAWSAPAEIHSSADVESELLEAWGLSPTDPDWSTGFDWTPGEAGADRALTTFIQHGLETYSHGRDRPAAIGSSRLSPHLHWGEVHPWRVVRAVRQAVEDGAAPQAEADKFVAELAWRDFSAQLLNAFPQMTTAAFRPEYDRMPWRDDAVGFAAWARGRTGFPIVDAGMRQLWASGWMHNRVRMIAASFLVKDLLIDWRRGEAWFWDTLVDADLANNVQNWQWVAGSGADASPYFRVFNPVTQGQTFDAQGRYVRRWLPELADLPDKWLHAPWTAPDEVLAAAGVRLGRDYPRPVVDHAQARDRALAALRTVAVDRDAAAD